MSKDVESTTQSLLVQLRILEAYYEDLVTRESLLSQALLENKAALTAVSSLPENHEMEIVVHIGGGLHIPVIFKPEKKLVVRLGAGIAIEKSKEDTVNFLSKRIEEIEKALQEVIAQRNETLKRISVIRDELNKLIKQK